MCSLARPSALGFDATAFLDRRRGVAAAAPVACSVMAREPARRAGAETSSSAARTQLKRARESMDDGTVAAKKSTAGEVMSVIPARGHQRLQERMREELDAVRVLHKRAFLLCRDAGRSGAVKGAARFSAAGLRREKPTEVAAKKRKTSSLESGRTELEHHKEAMKLQKRPVQRAAPPSAKEDAQKRRQMEVEEIARAREECRQQVLEVERAALPDETVYPQDLEELGIAPFEYVVTRTRRQALCGGSPR